MYIVKCIMDTPSLSFCQQNPFRLTQYFFKSNYPEFYTWLCEKYPDMRLSEKLYRYFHPDIQNICPICGKPTKYLNFTKGYSKHCSYTCSALDDRTKSKRKKTSRKKYGTDSPTQAESVKAKGRATMLERYGVEHALQHPKFLEKSKHTTLSNYGVEFAAQAREVKDKIKATCLKKYGVEHSAQAPEVKEKIRRSNLERLGVEYPMQSETVKAKSRATCIRRYNTSNPAQASVVRELTKANNLKKYGVEWAGQTPEVIQKRKQTSLERYGVENPLQYPEFRKKALEAYRLNRISNGDNPIIGYTPDGQWICKCPHPDCNKCSEKFYIIPNNFYYTRTRDHTETCTRLLPIGDVRSSLELAVCEILDQHNIPYETSNRTILGGLELDIYIPDRKIAIECNGIYWHSSKYKDVNYHMNKWLECKKASVQLISIWEDWLVNKPEIVESLVLSKLGIYEHRIGARQCEVTEISSKEANVFLNQNHIQGAGGSTIKLGLKYKGQLVAAMTFGKRRLGQGRKGDDAWELARFCSLKGWQVVGGAKRLLTHFIRQYQPKRIISFSCNDISDGTLYKRLGFTEDERPNTSYWYIDMMTLERYHRFTFSKNQIIRRGMAPSLDKSTWTEREVMESTDFVRLYDSGQTKWELSINL